MPQSYTDLLSHIVFSTRNRAATITADLRPDLYAYLGGIARNYKAAVLAIGGVEDHVHLLLKVHPTVAPAKMVQVLKANSSRWLRETRPKVRSFGWQTGYGAFSVSRSNSGAVIRYIENQEKHHRKMGFKEELLALLKRHGIDYDERYIWD